ncbi:hypothetical protein MSPP1_000439 [Malassezia sp. CBS 17886]|nr:hypothetical protein MSPP1_000439 [Malassezia sp. CBS 17886]
MLRVAIASAARLPRLPHAGGLGVRALNTSVARHGFWDTVLPLIQGNRRERQLQRQQGGLLPEDMRSVTEDQRRDEMVAAQSSTGEALVDDVLDTPQYRNRDMEHRRAAEKKEARLLRKRWGARMGPGGAAAAEHKYSTALFRISPRKLQLLASQISGKPINFAILQMQFSAKRTARRVRSTLALARDHAEAKGMDPRTLIVSEAWVNKGTYYKRLDIKGRARTGLMHHPQARMHVVLRPGKTWEQREANMLASAQRRVRSLGSGGVVRESPKIVNGFRHPGWQW